MDFTKLADKQEAITLINESGYYAKLGPDDLKGTTVYGMLDGEELVACAMVIRNGVQSYVNYLCVAHAHRDSGVGTVLLAKSSADLHKCGVRVIHASISGENAGSMALMKAYKPKIGWPYMNVVVSLEENNG